MDEASTSNGDGLRPAQDARNCRSRSTWTPHRGAFSPYVFRPSASPAGLAQRSSSLRVVVKRPLIARLTKDIVETYKNCNPAFKYSDALNPKRFLTNPAIGVHNDGYDNVNSDLILSVNFVLVNRSQQRYIVKDILGQGTFGQVVKCQVSETDSHVAVKVIKNQDAYTQQALVEVHILGLLNSKFDPDDKNHIVRMLDYFVYQHHLCITFEMLGSNLYELIRMNSFKGLPLSIIQLFSKQILRALVVMKEAGLIHCDLKPENILISTSLNPAEIKIIDFGSACFEHRTVYSYIQSRYYRSPEVLLGYPYTTAIDMWSFGCIVTELFLGLPLFPGASEFDLLKRMMATLGQQPPDHILNVARNTNKFFKRVGHIDDVGDVGASIGCKSPYQILTEEEYEARERKKPVIGKQYFNFVTLEDIVKNYPHRKNLPEEEIAKENSTRLALIDFLRGLVEFDPVKRWSPLQAVQHPFVTGEPFACPYKPLPETPRILVSQNVMVDYKPGGGRLVDSGLSPQVANMNKGYLPNSPHYQMSSFSVASSYGSLGSYGSYNDGIGVGGSYGSHGDGNSYTYHPSVMGPSGMSIHAHGGASILGASPDASRWRTSQMHHGNGFGASPSAAGAAFGPMSLGASPSQFTPPNSQIQVTSGSPGKYSGCASPARGGGIHGSPLGKAAAVGQFNRRRSLGCSSGVSSFQPHEGNATSQHWQGHPTDAMSSASHHEGNSRAHVGSSRGMQLQQTSNFHHWRVQKESSEKSDCSSSPPDPGDWDPNYSDEQLLQEDASDVNCIASGIATGMHLTHPLGSAIRTGAVGKFDQGSNQSPTSSSCSTANMRTNTTVQAYSHGHGNPTSVSDMHAMGYGPLSVPKQPSLHHVMPHFIPQSSPSRFSQQQQQPTHRFNYNHGHSTFAHGQPTPSSCNTTGPRSPGQGAFASGASSWGRRAGHPISANPPLSHARKDYGRIS
ncbi:dual specificity protein kinase YAK1 homolog [Aristolochia californica]|uniref:dual specificity protein kinase YAK1 homolog n=1 Tax=Aristolochia californica TaxID=171875 RepID=UPI0035E1600C